MTAFGKEEAAFKTGIGELRVTFLPESGGPKVGEWSRFIALELVLADSCTCPRSGLTMVQ